MIGPVLYQLVNISIILKGNLSITSTYIDDLDKRDNGEDDQIPMESELNKWITNSLKFTESKKPGSQREVPIYLFRLFSIMYRCLTKKGELILKELYREIIDEGVIIGLNM